MISVMEAPKPFVIRCKRCGCKFQYEFGDILKRTASSGYEIKCPVCDEMNPHCVEDEIEKFYEHINKYIPTAPAKDPLFSFGKYGYEVTCENKEPATDDIRSI